MNKLRILIIVYFALFQYSYSQELKDSDSSYHEFVGEGKIWANGLFTLCNYETGEICPFKSDYIKIENDTIINDTIWKILYGSTDEFHESWSGIGYIREESKMIYYKWHSPTPKLLYDFNLQVDDSIFLDGMWLNVDSIKYHPLLDNQIRKHFYLSFSKWVIVWIEGIGSINGFFYNTGLAWLVGGLPVLLCYEEDNIQIYRDTIYGNNTCYFPNIHTNIADKQEEPEILIYPNPANNIVNIEFKGIMNSTLIFLYSLNGELLLKQELNGNREIALNVEKYAGTVIIRILNDKMNISRILVINK